ncbi:MAG: transcriptional repressor [Candidatus Neomarinimicrobiota bacterium]|nr:transcriptional repressor [Candidatus Neomarinimicrobiota bacterium]MED5554354.1 transcriptional repressor [Candidatus Neomarinimicrobiota bacterium]|tara:strand:+ start:2687 stop:3109 length:423 start_codon:yes stop_codon:yes gene_type:complete
MNHIDQLKNILKTEGLRHTKQRQQVWDEIRISSEHRDAEEIYIAINKNKDLKVSRATVYRTIDVLVKNNLVRKMELGDGRALYEHKIDDGHHDHIICVETGKIIEFYNEDLEILQENIVKKHGYELVRHVHQLFVKPIKK